MRGKSSSSVGVVALAVASSWIGFLWQYIVDMPMPVDVPLITEG